MMEVEVDLPFPYEFALSFAYIKTLEVKLSFVLQEKYSWYIFPLTQFLGMIIYRLYLHF